MLQIQEWRILTWIPLALRPALRSMPSVVSLACRHCGCAIGVRVVDGISSFGFEIDWSQANSSRSKHVVVLTQGGKLSISCAHLPSAASASQTSSGASAITSSIPTSSKSAQPCGCDPGAKMRDGSTGHTCAECLSKMHGAGCVDELRDR